MIEDKKTNPLIKIGAGIMIGVGLGVLILFGLGLRNGIFSLFSSTAMTVNSPEVGTQAVDFELTNLEGEEVKLSEFRGKIVLINFWATWCGPCRVEMPIFQEYSMRHQDELVLLGVNAEETEDTVKGYVRRMGLTFEILLDPDGKVQRLYQLRGYPTSFLIDRDGVVKAQHIGMMTENQLKDYLLQVGINK